MQKIYTFQYYKVTATFENGDNMAVTLPAFGYGNALSEFEKGIYLMEHVTVNKDAKIVNITVEAAEKPAEESEENIQSENKVLQPGVIEPKSDNVIKGNFGQIPAEAEVQPEPTNNLEPQAE